MVVSKFLEISWIRCPQNWRLILGHLTLVGWVLGVGRKKQVCPRERTLKRKGGTFFERFKRRWKHAMNCSSFLCTLHQVVS